MVELSVQWEELQKALQGDKRRIFEATKNALRDAYAHHDRTVRRKRLGGPGRDSLGVRTGALRNTLGPWKVTGKDLRTLKGLTGIGNLQKGGLGSYARIHEFGGTIRAKKKYLTIPLDAAKTRSGALKGSARLVRRGGGFHTAGRLGQAADSRTFIFTSKSGRKFVAVPKRGGGVLPLYLLQKSVRIPKRLGFFDTWHSVERNRLPRFLRKQMLVSMKRKRLGL